MHLSECIGANCSTNTKVQKRSLTTDITNTDSLCFVRSSSSSSQSPSVRRTRTNPIIESCPTHSIRSEKEELRLKDHQLDHYKRISTILSYAPAAIDCSPMGQGKTCIAIKYALDNNLSLLAFCDVSMMDKIYEHSCKYGVKSVERMSYSKLRGTSRQEYDNIRISHKYLNHYDDKYHATDQLLELIKSGVLIIFDEFQALKNKSLQYHAALEIARTVSNLRGHTNSRIIYLSETGIDDYKLIENVVTLLCLTPHNRLISGSNQQGYDDILKISAAINPTLTKAIAPAHVTSKSVTFVTFQIYTNILKYYYSSSMPKLNITCSRDAKNCYYYVPDDQALSISTGITNLENNISFNPSGIVKNPATGKNINNLLMDIELAKVPLFARLVTQTLNTIKDSKVIVSLNYRKPVELLSNLISEYHPLVITGVTRSESPKKKQTYDFDPTNSSATRSSIINAFQEDSDRYRVLITCRVCRVGVDLDDQYGSRPRVLFLSPSYSYINFFQMSGRVYRTGTKSDVIIRSVYAYNPLYHSTMIRELRILQALHRKNRITKDMSTIDDDNNDVNNLFTDDAIFEDCISSSDLSNIFNSL